MSNLYEISEDLLRIFNDIENNEPACFEDEKVFIGYASVGKLSKLFEGFVKNLSLMQ